MMAAYLRTLGQSSFFCAKNSHIPGEKMVFPRFSCNLAMFATLLANAHGQANAQAIAPLTSTMKAAMTGKSWKPGCPVALDDLVSVRVIYVGFDGRSHDGDLIVHKRIAEDTSKVLQELYAIKFPINKVDLWDDYGPDVYAEQNITVGFYCERADDAPTEWSSHAYGMAVDINPLRNPFRDLQHTWWPRAAAQYVVRDDVAGKASTKSEAFGVFTRHGWVWGGFDAGVPDYMHFVKATVGDGARLDRPYVVTGLQYVPNSPTEAGQPK
jgi:hypothetical protein